MICSWCDCAVAVALCRVPCSYSPPPSPSFEKRLEEFCTNELAKRKSLALGVQVRDTLFALEEDTCYLAHGSYGAAFRCALCCVPRLPNSPVAVVGVYGGHREVLHCVQQWQIYLELQPVRFFCKGSWHCVAWTDRLPRLWQTAISTRTGSSRCGKLLLLLGQRPHA